MIFIKYFQLNCPFFRFCIFCFKIKNENLSMFVGLFAFVRAKNMISKKYKNSKFQP